MSKNVMNDKQTPAYGNSAKTAAGFAGPTPVSIVTIALALSGCAELMALFFIQPLLPKLASEYAIPVSHVSIILSAETALLALGLLFTGTLSDRFGQKRLIVTSLLVGGLLTILCPLATSWTQLVILRALIGLCLSGIAAAATSYISEEVAPAMAGIVTGYFVFGNSIGGMSGRVIASQLMDIVPLSSIFFVFGAILMAVGAFVAVFLPKCRNTSVANSLNLMAVIRGGTEHFRNLNISLFFVISFVIFGTFTSLYNFMAFYLHNAPFNVSFASAGLISTCFVLSFITAPQAGKLALKFGEMNVLAVMLGMMIVGIILTALATAAWFFIIGVVLFTAAFFGCHAIGLAWVSKNASRAKGQATAFYLFFYYMGGSVVGYISGLIFAAFGWTGLAICLATLLVGGIGITRILQSRIIAI